MPDQPEDPVGNLCAALGEDCVRAVARGFYTRVATDSILRPLYPDDDMPGAEERLADFLVMRFGGSTRYAETRGHPRLRMRHGPYRIGPAERDRWVKLMTQALNEEVADKHLRARAATFLADVATFLINAPGAAPTGAR